MEGVAELIAGTDLISTIVRCLLRSELLEDEKYLMSGILANLACHGYSFAGDLEFFPHDVYSQEMLGLLL